MLCTRFCSHLEMVLCPCEYLRHLDASSFFQELVLRSSEALLTLMRAARARQNKNLKLEIQRLALCASTSPSHNVMLLTSTRALARPAHVAPFLPLNKAQLSGDKTIHL